MVVVQSLELTTGELKKIESVWHVFLRKMVNNGFKRKNVPEEYLKARKKAKSTNAKQNIPKPDDLDWSFIYSNDDLRSITKTSNIAKFCKIQHLKYIAHVTRLDNSSFQKQILFSTEHKRYACDRWEKYAKELNISINQIQNTMKNKTEFMSLLHKIFK